MHPRRKATIPPLWGKRHSPPKGGRASDDDSPRTGRVSPCHSLSSSPSRSSLLREPGGAPAPPRSGERQSPTPFQLDRTATPPNVVHVPMSQRSETPIKTFSAVPEFDGKVLFACVLSLAQPGR